MRDQATDMSGHSGMREECLREACRSCSGEPECQIYPASSLLNLPPNVWQSKNRLAVTQTKARILKAYMMYFFLVVKTEA